MALTQAQFDTEIAPRRETCDAFFAQAETLKLLMADVYDRCQPSNPWAANYTLAWAANTFGPQFNGLLAQCRTALDGIAVVP